MNEATAQVPEEQPGETGGDVGQAQEPIAQSADVGTDWRDGLDPTIRASLDVDSLEDLA